MTGAIYNGIRQNSYSLAGRIGGGGEGDVYNVKENNTIVAKIYKEQPNQDKTTKLLFMASMANDELLRFAAWPIDIIHDRSGRIFGFIMRKLEGHVPLHMLLTPMDRKRTFPDKGYNFLAHVARNLAVAFHKIHQMNIVVGDVNEANILVNNTGMVALIDCDSFQIWDGTHYHFCEVGMLRYTPPEFLQRGSFENVIRTTNTDAFSLATLIFQILFLGRAPFTGINPSREEINEETAIKTYEFAYSLNRANKKLFPAKNSLELTALPSGLVDAFHNAFETSGKRPDALNWAKELSLLIQELVSCNKSKLHFYPSKLGRCPWCAFQQRDNIYYFLDDTYLKEMPELNNIEQFVNGFRPEPLAIKTLTASYNSTGLHAQKIESQFYNLRYFNWIGYAAIVLLTIILYGINAAYIIAGIIILVLYHNFSPIKKKLKDELAIRQKSFNDLKLVFQNLVKQHNTPPELKRFNDATRDLTSSINAFRNLPTEYSNAKKAIEEKYYQSKLNQYLQQFDIRYHPINSFGAAKKRLIYQNGIRTAADIYKLRNIKISGIGPKNEQILYDWQRHIATGFTYRPDMEAINRDVGVVAEVIIKKRKQLEIDINHQYKMVIGLRVMVLSSVSTLEKQYHDLLPKVHQAELDLQAFQKLTK
jgi:DNA-binding helix-hairpin-helix protein with protein kinase domain